MYLFLHLLKSDITLLMYTELFTYYKCFIKTLTNFYHLPFPN